MTEKAFEAVEAYMYEVPTMSHNQVQDILIDAIGTINKAMVVKVDSVSLCVAAQIARHIQTAQNNLQRAIDLL